MKLLIIEGPDRCGKNTLIQKFLNQSENSIVRHWGSAKGDTDEIKRVNQFNFFKKEFILADKRNMFDMGDLNMFTSAALYPSITEKGRFRFINKFNLKYDLPRDFYIKATLDYSYDNKPIEGVTPDDYVYTFGIGWEL